MDEMADYRGTPLAAPEAAALLALDCVLRTEIPRQSGDDREPILALKPCRAK